MPKNRKHFFRETLLPFLYALVIVSLIGAIAFFGFRYRAGSDRAPDAPPRKGTQLLKYSGGWLRVNDPSIPARGNADVGFSAYSFAHEAHLDLPPEKISAEMNWKCAEVPEIQLPAEDAFPGFDGVLPDFSVPAPLPDKTCVVRYGDGTLFPVGKSFADVPSGNPVSRTVVRIIPVGNGTLCRLILAESCGDPALDDYALRELAEIKSGKNQTVCIDWNMPGEKK